MNCIVVNDNKISQMKANRLVNESSPYLKQHAYNPVEWFPWGKEALEKAKKEKRLIFISIGYSACHWCHVMERESFNNHSIAKFLNDNFVNIKIDREERPDLDQTYMAAVQLMAGGAGWPLNCFTTPEGKPFYGGTYFNPEQFYDVITELHKIWIENPLKIFSHADGLCEGIKNSSLIQEKIIDYGLPSIDTVYNKLKSEFDPDLGGFKRVPKFPMPSVYQFLLRYYYYSGDESAFIHVQNTVDHIIRGGIFDHIGGGIARYSTDKKWFVPHFEKMLYDNAQFISLLSELYSITRNEIYKDKLYQTAAFLERELSNGAGGYYSSLDADSEGEEGKFYLWREKEVREITGKDFPLAAKWYSISISGNWEAGKNILWNEMTENEFIAINDLSKEEFSDKIQKINKALFEHRKSRIRPGLDDKVLTSWNALMIKAYAEAYHATGDDTFKCKAISTGNYILDSMIGSDYILYRSNDRKIQGFLDDYAYVAKAFIYLYQVTFDESWLARVKKLIDSIFSEFYDENTGMFFYSPESTVNPVTRQLELTDNVIPSSNSSLAKVLFYAATYFDNPHYLTIAKQMLINIQAHLVRSPSYFSNWLTLLLMFQADFSEVVITGEKMLEIRKGFCGHFHPHLLFAGAEKSSELSLFHGRLGKSSSLIYVCRNRTCKTPVHTVDEAMKLLKE